MSVGAPQPDDAFVQILAHYHQTEQARIEQAKNRLRDVILPRLKQWGVTKIEANYSGYGDSGSIDRIDYLDSAGEPMNMNLVRPASDPDMENVIYEFLPSGFENNDGGQGTLTIDVSAGKVSLLHGDNETVTHENSEEWEV